MKLRVISSAVIAALYGAASFSAAAALADNHRAPVHQLQAPNINLDQVAADTATRTANSHVAANSGVNIQINSQRNKFVAEDGLTGEHVYIVRLHDQPLAQALSSRSGTTRSTSKKNKLFIAGEPANAEVQAYQSKLLNRQASVISSVAAVTGNNQVRHQFTNAINGFTMLMTQEQAEAASKLGTVASIQRSKIYQLHTDAGPELIQADKVWSGEKTPTGVPYKGEGQIVGIVDTGINTDHRSFAATGDDGYTVQNPWGSGQYVGDCTKEGFDTLCNDKLIGVRSYPSITDLFTTGELGAVRPAIGEDYQGHGSHTASTAAGNVLKHVELSTAAIGAVNDGDIIKPDFFPQMSGVAPHANVISYQVCYPTNESYTGCPAEALLAGVEDAIKDGVDVINFSIGGQDSNPWEDDVELAFLAAREAGISVATAAGNSGQTGGAEEYFGAIDHSSPWLLNVAAGTHNREMAIDTRLVDPQGGSEAPVWSEIQGSAINNTEITGIVVEAKAFGDEYCGTPFPANAFADLTDADGNPTDVIVICKRNSLSDANGIARTVKADNVKAAGGDGMVMYNFAKGDGLATTATYSIPSIHITYEEYYGTAENNNYGLNDWLKKGTGQTLTMTKTDIRRDLIAEKADWLAPFSSRGPASPIIESLIPAVTAPGVDIYAAFADEHPFATGVTSGDFAFLSGTSMASPHVAGSMALIRQAHPEWTAAEVQSALMMTTDDVVKYWRLNREGTVEGHASTYRAGSGRINVANAVQAGLIMDETADNFKAANPDNGGVVHRLNTPQLVNFSCKPNCQWIRTVKATKDGTWKISHGDVINWDMDVNNQSAQNGAFIKATPEEFSLKAGETQTIVIEASITDTQTVFTNSEVELHSKLILTETTGASPESHWPVVFKYDKNNMPAKLEAIAHRNQSSQVFKGIVLPAGSTTYGRAMTPVKADVKTVTLRADNERVFPWSATNADDIAMEDRLDDSTYVEMIDVPVGTKRFITEVMGVEESPLKGSLDVGLPLVYVGKDYNGNGQPDLDDELLCVSNDTWENNYCNVNNPEPGQYWVVYYNPSKGNAQDNWMDSPEETFRIANTVIAETPASQISVDVPESNGEPVDVTVSWDMPDMVEGDVYYSSIDFGTSEANAGNIGRTAFKLTRGVSDVSLASPKVAAIKGEEVPLNFKVEPNNTGADRKFTITADMPEGLTLSAEDVFASNNSIVGSVTVEDGKLTIMGTQPDTSRLEPTYHVTTNETDAMCRTPDFGSSKPGGYVDLAEFNIMPSFSGFSSVEYGANGKALNGKDNTINAKFGQVIPVSTLFNGAYNSLHLFDNGKDLNVSPNNAIELRGTGVISLDAGTPISSPYHYEFPHQVESNKEYFGVLWRSVVVSPSLNMYNYDQMSLPLDTTGSDRSGISLASTPSGWAIIEYDNARSYTQIGRDANRVMQYEEKDDRFDFELLINAETRYGEHEYEFMMAYDNIDFGTQDGRGSIGFRGFKGIVSKFGPVSGMFLGKGYAWNDLEDKIKSGLVVCYDYVGPESSQFEVTAWAKVAAVGKPLVVNAVSQVEGMQDIAMSYTVTAPSNISLGKISDKSIDENTSLEDLAIIYADEENSVNTISVSGEHITAVVNGHTSGSTVTITPDADFNGEVEVTVTVSDVESPTDAASTRFMLTVVSDGVEPVAPTTPEVTTPENTSSGGGALGGLAMLFALAAMVRRRVTHK